MFQLGSIGIVILQSLLFIDMTFHSWTFNDTLAAARALGRCWLLKRTIRLLSHLQGPKWLARSDAVEVCMEQLQMEQLDVVYPVYICISVLRIQSNTWLRMLRPRHLGESDPDGEQCHNQTDLSRCRPCGTGWTWKILESAFRSFKYFWRFPATGFTVSHTYFEREITSPD